MLYFCLPHGYEKSLLLKFVQEAGGHNRIPEFNLVVFKEGLYTVEFHKSIAVVQAFSASVAILHDRQNARCFSNLQSQH